MKAVMRSNFCPKSGRGRKASIRWTTRRTPSSRVISRNINTIHVEADPAMAQQLSDVEKISHSAANIEDLFRARQIELDLANPADVDFDPAIEVEIFRPVRTGICDS